MAAAKMAACARSLAARRASALAEAERTTGWLASLRRTLGRAEAARERDEVVSQLRGALSAA